MVDHSTSAVPRRTSLHAPAHVKISVRMTYEIILRTDSSATPGLAETEFAQARSNQREAWDDHNSKQMARPANYHEAKNVGNQLALAVAKRGLWTIASVIILKVMAFCESISGTVDFAQMMVQGLANLLKLF